MTELAPHAVFVYGTLKRGQCRAPLWPAAPSAVTEGWVRGCLFSREDYPAMTAGSDRVLGEWWLFAVDHLPLVLQTLDQIEGTNQPQRQDLYHRDVVEVFNRTDELIGSAFTYRYAIDPALDGFTLIQAPASERYVAWPAGA